MSIDRGAAAVTFINSLRHSKGRHAGQPFELLPWQEGLVRTLFGTLRPDGTRQYRTCYVEVPRKNGKSQLAAAIALKLLVADREPEAEVIVAACDREQASLIFSAAVSMINSSEHLRGIAHIIDHTKRIIIERGPAKGSVLRAISADAASAHGLNASAVIADELHVWPNRDLWDVLTTSTCARQQPVILAITTAGYDRTSLCWELHQHAVEVRDGVVDDPRHLPVLYGAGEEEDWTDPEVWKKANPSYGVTILPEYLEDECRQAQQVPGRQNSFRRLHLCQWTAGSSRWLDMGAWDRCGRPVPDMAGRACYAGLDLSASTDLTAFVLVFPPDDPEKGDYYVIPHFWIPQERLQERVRRDHVPYDLWAQQGYLTATPGPSVAYGAVESHIEAVASMYRLQAVAFDRWGATQITQRLSEHGINVVPFGQGFAQMSAPAKEVERLVLDGRLVHGGHPVLRWNADSCQVEQDPAGNIKPSKKVSTQRIDGIVAMVMALDGALRRETKPVPVFLGTDTPSRPAAPGWLEEPVNPWFPGAGRAPRGW